MIAALASPSIFKSVATLQGPIVGMAAQILSIVPPLHNHASLFSADAEV